MKHIVDLLGRLFLGFIFWFEAYDSIFYYKETKEAMTSYGLTWNQDLLLMGAIFVLLLGGTLLLIGYRVQLSAVLLLVYWVPLTFIIHAFWNDPANCMVVNECYGTMDELRRIQSILFMKNVAITGGLFMVFANGTGKYSIKRLFATAKVPGA